jgi:hypothetical protein
MMIAVISHGSVRLRKGLLARLSFALTESIKLPFKLIMMKLAGEELYPGVLKHTARERAAQPPDEHSNRSGSCVLLRLVTRCKTAEVAEIVWRGKKRCVSKGFKAQPTVFLSVTSAFA